MSELNNQPVPAPANCAACKFSREVRPDPTAIQSQIICMLMPPSPVAIQRGVQVQILPMFPIVNAQMSCFQFQPVIVEPTTD